MTQCPPAGSHASTAVTHAGVILPNSVGSVIGTVWGIVRVGSGDGSGQHAVSALDQDLPTVGIVSGDQAGEPIAGDPSLLLDSTSYERAGWDLDTVWHPPTETSVPTLR